MFRTHERGHPGNIFVMAPIRKATAKAIIRHDRANRYRRRLFPGNIQDLGLELALGLRLAALRAGIRKDVMPEAFRRIKIRTFHEACARPDVIVNALGWSQELGLARRRGYRHPAETLEEAAGVLGNGPDMEKKGWRGRFVEWLTRAGGARGRVPLRPLGLWGWCQNGHSSRRMNDIYINRDR